MLFRSTEADGDPLPGMGSETAEGTTTAAATASGDDVLARVLGVGGLVVGAVGVAIAVVATRRKQSV